MPEPVENATPVVKILIFLNELLARSESTGKLMLTHREITQLVAMVSALMVATPKATPVPLYHRYATKTWWQVERGET